jgi:hypothetical protein
MGLHPYLDERHPLQTVLGFLSESEHTVLKHRQPLSPIKLSADTMVQLAFSRRSPQKAIGS